MIFKSIFRQTPKAVTIPEEHLPLLHSFVEVAVGGRRMRSVPVEEIAEQHIAVGEAMGRVGERGAFVYQNPSGKFRFGATIVQVKNGFTYFTRPQKIEALGNGKRASVRMDTLLPGTWRMAPDGIGVGEFMKGSIRDISCGGCSLITDRQCKVAQWLEVRVVLRNDAQPLTLLGEIKRVEVVPTSGKFSHGLRFHALAADEEKAIREFIHRRQTELRNRGLA
jgi:hypothetical protein